jgi:predicted nicotinamide N-methyase
VLRAFALDPIGTVSIEEMSSAGLLKLSTRTYWRRVWPAGVGLASYIVERFGTDGLRDRDVLDLGCGVGLVGIVCGRLGARVTFLDREPGALTAVRRNCRRNGLAPARTIGGDWNHGGHRVEPAAYDLVVGGDVIYDDLEWPAIGIALMRTLRVGGIALLADPGWVARSKLRGAFRRSGFTVARRRRRVSWPPWRTTHQRIKDIDIYELGRRDAPQPSQSPHPTLSPQGKGQGERLTPRAHPAS